MNVEHIDVVKRATASAQPIPPAPLPRQSAHKGGDDRSLVVIGELERELLELVAEDVRYPLRHAARLADASLRVRSGVSGVESPATIR
ncbi:hypothetical protein GCM10009588_26420 [Microbacterium phyllosphaerae]